MSWKERKQKMVMYDWNGNLSGCGCDNNYDLHLNKHAMTDDRKPEWKTLEAVFRKIVMNH